MDGYLIFLAGCLILMKPIYVSCHARLMEPPSRSSMWRVGFPTRKNFDDNALYCGGLMVQWARNGGKCGICGDPWNMPHPRANEAGGIYGRGIISRKYSSGQVIKAVVEVTTNHKGYFEFRLCPNNNSKKEASQQCLDQHLLMNADGHGTRYYIGDKGSGKISVALRLPRGITCSQCVLQWTYVTGNNWGVCPDGSTGLGCGPQETFRGCADIAIEKSPDFVNGHQYFQPHPSQNDVGNAIPEILKHFPKFNKHFIPQEKPTAQSLEAASTTKDKGYNFIYQSPSRWHMRVLMLPSSQDFGFPEDSEDSLNSQPLFYNLNSSSR